MFETLAVSTGVVALGEIGDKTQLLALLLAARYRRPGAICMGILVATVLNHLLAAALGAWLASHLDPLWGRALLGLSFAAVAIWMLVPDDASGVQVGGPSGLGVFGITTLAFFLAEMGDKTQIATVMLAARYESVLWVTLGTTAGMMLANVPAVLLGDTLLRRLPVKWLHRLAAFTFATMAALVFAGFGA